MNDTTNTLVDGDVLQGVPGEQQSYSLGRASSSAPAFLQHDGDSESPESPLGVASILFGSLTEEPGAIPFVTVLRPLRGQDARTANQYSRHRSSGLRQSGAFRPPVPSFANPSNYREEGLTMEAVLKNCGGLLSPMVLATQQEQQAWIDSHPPNTTTWTPARTNQETTSVNDQSNDNRNGDQDVRESDMSRLHYFLSAFSSSDRDLLYDHEDGDGASDGCH